MRNAVDQKTYWFLAAAAAAVVGILSQWKTVYCADGSAGVVFVGLGIAAVVSDVPMTLGLPLRRKVEYLG